MIVYGQNIVQWQKRLEEEFGFYVSFDIVSYVESALDMTNLLSLAKDVRYTDLKSDVMNTAQID